jgi:tRNA 2-thiouridine synthesizing protein A
VSASVDVLVDARGSDCPAPLMEMIRAVQAAQVGQVVAVLSDDSMARTDIPLWAEKSGNALLGVERHDDCDEFLVRKLHRRLSHAEEIGR